MFKGLGMSGLEDWVRLWGPRGEQQYGDTEVEAGSSWLGGYVVMGWSGVKTWRCLVTERLTQIGADESGNLRQSDPERRVLG